MTLTLSVPDLSEDIRPSLTLVEIEDMKVRCTAYIDDLVAEQRLLYPGLTEGSIRHILTKGQSDFAATERLLKDAQQ